MSFTNYLLLGGGLASAKAAGQLRKQAPESSITLVSSEPHLPYHRPPLSKEYLRGEGSKDKVFIAAEQFYKDNKVDLIRGVAAKKLDLQGKSVTLEDGSSLEFEKALLATGGRPKKLPVSGAHLPGVYYLRTVDDSEAIQREIAPGRRAVIVGAGFIGMEIAASLTQKGVDVTVIEVAPYIWSRFLDEKMAAFFQGYCEESGIAFLTGESVAEFRGDTRVARVITQSGREMPCDFACIGVGIDLNIEFAQEAGLKIDNGIEVNEFMQCSHPDVYAAGDVANYYDPIFEKRRRVEHWGHAEYTGMLAAQNMAGEGKPYDLLSYVWSDIFDLHLEFAGDETEHDQLLVRGKRDENSFIVLYLKENLLRAYFAVNASAREFLPLQRLIRRRVDLSSHHSCLEDKEFNLKTLLEAG